MSWIARVDDAVHRLARAEWIAQLLVRLFVGYFFAETGWGKVHDLPAMTQRFVEWGIPAPAFNAALSGWTELLGGVLLMAGLSTRLVSIPLFVNMAVAVLSVKLKKVGGLDDFVELDEPLYALSFLWLFLAGPGKASLDHLIARALRRGRGGHGHAGHGHGEHGHGEHGHGEHGRDRFGNPVDLGEYLQRLEGPERAAWQKPDEVVAALALRPGDTAGEIGAGPGYFTLRMARAVGPTGRVLAAEAHPRMIEILEARLAAACLSNVTPLRAESDDPRFPDASCDLVLMVNAFHHFPDPAAYLRRVARALKPGGRIVNIDFHERELPVGPPPERKVSREAFLSLAREAGLEAAGEHGFLPYQYFVVLRPGAPPGKP